MPPSDSANRMSGNFLSTRDHRRSAAAWQMFIGCSVIITSTGASAAVIASWPDEPRWIDRTMSGVAHAAQNGSQCSAWKLG